MKSACLSCQLNKKPDLSVGGRIKEYKHWIIEHFVPPIPIKGWLILKTKRHTEGITGLNKDESEELGQILNIVPKKLKKVVNAEMVYILCLTEVVKHLHFHIIPRSKKEKQKGLELLKIWEEVKSGKTKAVSTSEVKKIVTKLRQELK